MTHFHFFSAFSLFYLPACYVPGLCTELVTKSDFILMLTLNDGIVRRRIIHYLGLILLKKELNFSPYGDNFRM